jgi:AcrR family transcriptional regulator
MRHLAITIGTAALVVGLFLGGRALRRESSFESPVAPRSSPAPVDSPSESRPGPKDGGTASPGVLITGMSELERLHRQHGAVGESMRAFFSLTQGHHWNLVDRKRMQEVLYALRYGVKEEDIPYLRQLFDSTPDPSFRWWFSWLVAQIAEQMAEKFPGDVFVDPMTEVYRLDPVRGYAALTVINKPAAMERFLKLFEAEADPEARLNAIASFAHSDWPNKEDVISGMVRDAARAPADRMEALTALGLVGVSEGSLALAMDVALGPPQPAPALTGSLAITHPVADVRSAAVLAVMQRGDQESARRLLEAADGADADLTKLVEHHIAAYGGPDLSEFIISRAKRRGSIGPGEVRQLMRDPDRIDRARLRDVQPLIKDPETKEMVRQLLSN